jgi:hypothetical protein
VRRQRRRRARGGARRGGQVRCAAGGTPWRHAAPPLVPSTRSPTPPPPRPSSPARYRPPRSSVIAIAEHCPAALSRDGWSLDVFEIRAKMYSGHISSVYRAVRRVARPMAARRRRRAPGGGVMPRAAAACGGPSRRWRLRGRCSGGSFPRPTHPPAPPPSHLPGAPHQRHHGGPQDVPPRHAQRHGAPPDRARDLAAHPAAPPLHHRALRRVEGRRLHLPRAGVGARGGRGRGRVRGCRNRMPSGTAECLGRRRCAREPGAGRPCSPPRGPARPPPPPPPSAE